MGSAALAVAALLAACGGSSNDANQPSGKYPVKVVAASFPSKQSVGQTALLKIAVHNSGEKTVPDLVVNVGIQGKEGEGAQIPFSVHDPQVGLANADRPVWVLAARYPRLEGESTPAGAETSSPQTYAFGEIKPGKTVEAVWKLSAVRAGKYTVAYEVGAGLTSEAKAVTGSGAAPGGTFVADISTSLPETEVNGAGEIVEIKPEAGSKKQGG